MNQISIFAKSLVSPVIVTALLASISVTQYYNDLEKRGRPLIPPTIIPAQAVKIADLGLHAAAASAMWVYTIQQVTEHPDKLTELIENVTATDPKFSYPYAFASLVLPDISKSPDKAVEIAEHGIKNADPDWRIPYYLATTYHIFFKDREKAVFYFDIAARTSGAPLTVKSMPARYGTYQTIREQTKNIWLSIYDNSKDKLVKERALSYIKQLEILELLEKAVDLYKQRYGAYPKNINDLVKNKILKTIPPSPVGLEFYLGLNGRVKY